MAKDKPAPAEPPTQYVALTDLTYWSEGKLRRVPAGQVVDDVPQAAVDNWLTINPPAIRIATDDDTKGVTP